MTEAEKRAHRVCFTGHRPEKLTRFEWLIKRDLEKQIRQAIADGLDVFITGMARGVDIWAAEIVLKLRRKGAPIKLICACPYEGFEEHGNPAGKIGTGRFLMKLIWCVTSALIIARTAFRSETNGWSTMPLG